jgi:type II secretory ATPase GspE/PulE/Tfp pilus assembly ATPase PilB-like protein
MQVQASPELFNLPLELCRSHRIVPISKQKDAGIVFATDDPFSVFAYDWLSKKTGRDLNLVMVSKAVLDDLLDRLEKGAGSNTSEAKTVGIGIAKPEAVSEEPIIRLVDSVLADAVKMRASDIHIEARSEDMRIRYRVDGVLMDANTTSKTLHGPVISRIKIMSGLNIAEKRLPQDGRMQISAVRGSIDVRVSILPALHGEAVVMRLLEKTESLSGLSELGMSEHDRERWTQLIKRPYGMVLVTGPTGSGKTTTLYATLSFLNSPEKKLISVEDPVEYRLQGINQVQVKPLIGLSFAAGLRAMLRQAPDVIMVGEIRDKETAQIAIQAALTGHLVLSTLHTNDATSAITRLIDMGIPPFLVASTVQGVMAQRLIRRICPSCKDKRKASSDEKQFLGKQASQEVFFGSGCEDCHKSGYKGRIGIYELICMSDALRGLIVAKQASSVLRRHALGEGMVSIRDDGLSKVLQGLSSVSEVIRATPEGIM